MSLVEISFGEFMELEIGEVIGRHKYISIIGSRNISDLLHVMKFIRDTAYFMCYELSCKVVSGGAYGPDQAGMEGALNIKLHDLDSIIPLDSRKASKIDPLITRLTGISPLVDEIECVFTTDRLIVFYPDFRSGYNVGEYFVRDKKISRMGDVILAFWDGESRGTKKTVDYAIEDGKKVYLIKC